MAYIVPQVLIKQLISEVSLNTVKNQNVLVIGPNYELYRYSDPDEKKKISIGRWDVNGLVSDAEPVQVYVDGTQVEALEYPGLVANAVPDESYVKVFADNAVIELGKFDGEFTVDEEVSGTGLKTKVQFNCFVSGSGKPTAIKRDIVAGDYVEIKYDDPSTEGPGVFVSRIDKVADYIDESDDSEGSYIVLSDAVPAEAEDGDLYFCTALDGVEIKSKTDTKGTYNWRTGSSAGDDDEKFGIQFPNTSLKVGYGNWGYAAQFDVVSADLFVEYRALLRDAAASIETLASHAKVATTLGTVHPDNPLAFGAYMALLNSGDRVVYYCGVSSDDLDGYNEALGKAELTDEVYIIVPMTRDADVIAAVKAHCESMSGESNKRWRIGFVAKEVDVADPIYDEASSPYGAPYYASFRENSEHKLRIMTFKRKSGESDDSYDDDKFVKCKDELRVNDVVRVYTGNTHDTWDETPKYTEYKIARILTSNSVLLADEVDTNTADDDYHAAGIPQWSADTVVKVEVVRYLSGNDFVRRVRDVSSSLATRRMYNVFPDAASTGGVQYGGEFLAAAAAGLVSSVLPQQPLTNVELNGIDDIPKVYQTYSREQLNTIAEGGTFIIMQDRPGAKVYVRHQISTDYQSGNLLKAELSITKNLDSISYYFAEMFAPFIGKYNITPELIEVVRSKLNEGLAALETSTSAGLYGPQVIEEGTEIVDLYQHPVNKDHIFATVRLNLPVPFNYFDLNLEI